jgi:high-affinity K+ transport system ATPase subunit B
MKATDVKALAGYKINVMFEDGVSGVIDLYDLVQKGIFKTLQDVANFQKVYTTGSSIAWSDELEIDADNIYAELMHAEPAKLLHNHTH